MAAAHRLLLGLLLQVVGTSAASPSVAVTGATGKLGRLAVQQLVSKNVRVRVLLRHDPASASEASGAAEATAPQVAAWLKGMPGVTLVKGDVNDRDSIMALLDGCSACLAMHGARRMRKLSDLWQDPSEEPTHSKQINYVGVQNIINAARASGTCKRIVRVTGVWTSELRLALWPFPACACRRTLTTDRRPSLPDEGRHQSANPHERPHYPRAGKGEDPWSVFSILINGLGSMAKAWNYEGEQLLRACEDVDYTIVSVPLRPCAQQCLHVERATC
eukprot:scaffold20827_cov129-Isochrysis_galbana.AAC.1